ncbi:alpha/beta hydrolase [Sulfurifustis variabilis]|uniref:Alpha/beta hydrolase n=1 Tax=Sulfurifustis variabilis TaxID=1675686 RepID=A0A1C7AEW6_9GAMM|nr:alpha/beta fold hydrolase [Sulfurifustis variabilis]BAU49728.1 alpha/beta hydrolase [Sulfurifustis variabilis]
MAREQRLRLADGRILAWLALGDPAGRPVLYFHGYPGSRLEARLASDAARGLGLRVLAPDRPGFGASTFQPGRTIGAWAADVAELADRLALERFAVVGVSGGGPYALACAARLPERVSRAALVGALGPLGRMPLAPDMVGLNRLALALAARTPLLARLAVRLAARWVRQDPERWLAHMMSGAPAADRRVLADPGYRALFTASTAEALRQGGRGAAWELTLLARPWDFSLKEVRVPVRIWQGLDDNIVPPAIAQRLAAALPDSESRCLPDEGHLSLIVCHLDAVLAELRSAKEESADG